MTAARRAARTLALIGLVLVVGTTLVGAAFAPGALVFALWAALPYVLLWTLTRVVANGWALVGGASAVLVAEAYIRGQVFLFPRSSTASLVLIFSPIYLSVGALPAGLGAGWLVGWLWRHAGWAGRAGLAGGLGAAVLTGAIVLVRPDLLPGPVARLVAAPERIGPPRIVVGEGELRKSRIAERSAWYQVGDFDEPTGENVIAAVDSRMLVLLDPTNGAERKRTELADEARRQWNWFSRLVRDGSELLIVQTGGGYSEVAVLDLAGRPRWAFHPDAASVPPIALLPADLDGDGRPEFYSAAAGSVYRLDGTGRVVWQRTVEGLVQALDVTLPSAGHPAMVATVTSARRIHLWSPTGELLGTVPLVEKEAYRFTFADWPRARSLVGGVERLVVLSLVGRPVLQFPLGDFRFQEARAVRLGEDGATYLAVLAAGPREVGRSRLLVFGPDGALIYDEILAGSRRLQVLPDPRAPRDTLLLAGDGLWRYGR